MQAVVVLIISQVIITENVLWKWGHLGYLLLTQGYNLAPSPLVNCGFENTRIYSITDKPEQNTVQLESSNPFCLFFFFFFFSASTSSLRFIMNILARISPLHHVFEFTAWLV